MGLKVDFFGVKSNAKKEEERKRDYKTLVIHMILLQETFQFHIFAFKLQCKIYFLLWLTEERYTPNG